MHFLVADPVLVEPAGHPPEGGSDMLDFGKIARQFQSVGLVAARKFVCTVGQSRQGPGNGSRYQQTNQNGRQGNDQHNDDILIAVNF